MQQMALNLDFYAPFFSIKIGGKPQPELKNAVISLEVDENLESASMFTMNINEGLDIKTQKFTWLDSKLLAPESGEDVEIYIGCYNFNGVATDFFNHQISAAFAGGGMTQTNVDDFTDELETFMDAIGAGIID